MTAATYDELRSALRNASGCVDVTITADIVVEANADPDGSGLYVGEGGDVVLRGATGNERVSGGSEHRRR